MKEKKKKKKITEMDGVMTAVFVVTKDKKS